MSRDQHNVTVPVEDYERMRQGLARYEFVRCLSVQQFSEMLFERNLKDGIPFDKLVDIEMEAAKRELHEERLKRTKYRPGEW